MVLKKDASVWEAFVQAEGLTKKQEQQFETYLYTLIEWNKQHNLTALYTPKQIIRGHFQDSLRLSLYIEMGEIQGVADIGSGGGFPGIPLKIKYPHLAVVLIEVKKKKIQFLNHMIQILGLTGIEVYPYDWRTFLRTTSYNIDLFCARASLHVDELLRLFKPGCRYREARLVYWASKNWQPLPEEVPYIVDDIAYSIGRKKRRYIILRRST